jgi:hypothetical protein
LASANEAIQSHTGEEARSDAITSKLSVKKVNVRNGKCVWLLELVTFVEELAQMGQFMIFFILIPVSSPMRLAIHQMRWFALCGVCIYPKLMPVARFNPPTAPLSEKAVFTEAEDK